MTVSLGGITLSEDLTLNGVTNFSSVALQTNQTLGGGLVINGITLTAGRVLELIAIQDGNSLYGYFTGDQVAQFISFRDTMQKIELIHHLGVFSVMITELNLQVATGTVNPDSATWYTGVVTTIEV